MKTRLVVFTLLAVWSLVGLGSSTWAHVRNPVSVARADMRSMETALEAYHIDHDAFPPSSGSPEFRLEAHWLTTPTAHLSNAFPDVFKVRLPITSDSLTFVLLHDPIFGIIVALCAALLAVHLLYLRLQKRAVAKWVRTTLITAIITLWIFLILILLPGLPRSWYRDSTGTHITGYESNPHWQSDYLGFNYLAEESGGWALQSIGPNGIRDLEDLSSVPIASSVGGTFEFLTPFTYDPTNGGLSGGDLFRIGFPEPMPPVQVETPW